MNETALHPSDAVAQTRRATIIDMESVAKLHRFSFFDAMPHMPVLHTPEEDLNYYSTVVFPNTEIWISERSGITAGIISFRPGWIDHLYVHPNYQASGIGSTLLARAQSSQHSLRLWTFQCNLRARRFYERRGFQIERETDGADNEERQPDILYFWSRQAADRQAEQGGGANSAALRGSS